MKSLFFAIRPAEVRVTYLCHMRLVDRPGISDCSGTRRLASVMREMFIEVRACDLDPQRLGPFVPSRLCGRAASASRSTP